MTAPIRPIGVSKTGIVEPSPKPQIKRSAAVGKLSVFAQVATGREEQDGAIEGAAVALDDRDHHVVGVPSGDPGEPVDGRAADVNRRFKVALEMLPTLWGAVTDYGPERHPFRIAR